MVDSSFLDRLIERLDRLDPSSVQGYILRLVRERGFLETVFQTIREGIIIIDRELNIHYVNNAAVHLLGLPESCENHKINRFLRELDWERLIAQDPKEWQWASRQEIEVFYPNHRYLQFYILPYDNQQEQDDDIEMAVIILHDVTELRARTESTIESERLAAITTLAAGVAHEIGNPLNSLAIHLQLLERCFGDLGEQCPEEAHELLGIARQEVERLDTIIAQFLKAVRPAHIEKKPVLLKNLISDTINFMKQEIEDRGIFVEGTWADNIPPVLGDATQLKQAAYNIIKNAIQAMPEGGLLKISLSADPDSVLLVFADNGKGIAGDEMGNVFDPYYTTREEGTGLGLMIVERIVREHDAELGIQSEPGEGTVVSIRFSIGDRRPRLLAAAARSGDNETTVSESISQEGT